MIGAVIVIIFIIQIGNIATVSAQIDGKLSRGWSDAIILMSSILVALLCGWQATRNDRV
jgi:hypothetical protein